MSPLMTPMPVGRFPTRIDLPTGSPVCGSKRVTVSSPLLVTHTEPAPNAVPTGALPTAIVFTLAPLPPRSMRETVLLPSLTHRVVGDGDSDWVVANGNRLDHTGVHYSADVVIAGVRDPDRCPLLAIPRGSLPTRIGGPIGAPARASSTVTVPSPAFATYTEFSSAVREYGSRPTWIGFPGRPLATAIRVTSPAPTLETQNASPALTTAEGPDGRGMSVRSLPSWLIRVTVESPLLATQSTLELPAMPSGSFSHRQRCTDDPRALGG
jgi:hypothetical protein